MAEIEVEPTILKNYDIHKRLGKGAYGIVWKVRNRKSGVVYALKKIFDAFRNQTDAQRTYREITFLQEFSGHPNIIRLLNVIKSENDEDIYLVFEYMESDLHKCIKKGNVLDDIHKRYIFYQLLKAIKFIHSANVIHRDLKPSNVLLDSACRAKLCDFGLMRSLTNVTGTNQPSFEELSDSGVQSGDPELTEYVATRWYRAPEILLASNRYTKFVDMWSLGCILAEMLLGKPLFPGTSTINQIEKIVSAMPKPTTQDILNLQSDYGTPVLEQALQKSGGTLESLFPATVASNAFDMVKRLLQLNPLKRLTVEDALEHTYVEKFHDPQDEPVMNRVVTPSLCDDKHLSVSDYRTKLYEIILEKKAQRRIKRLLQSVDTVDELRSCGLLSTPSSGLEYSSRMSDEGTQTHLPEHQHRNPEIEQTYSNERHCGNRLDTRTKTALRPGPPNDLTSKQRPYRTKSYTASPKSVHITTRRPQQLITPEGDSRATDRFDQKPPLNSDGLKSCQSQGI
ncbi:unnamed protein product [Dicrocoelium dendriticum]|nr:unnamed protein product [Dicrocoelium dendriticum]